MNLVDKKVKIEQTAKRIIRISHDTILMNLRFLDVALSNLTWKSRPGTGIIACNGRDILYDPVLVIRKYRTDQHSITRLYLHILFHMVFHHPFQYEKLQTKEWDFATDIAVSNIILELELYHTSGKDDAERLQKLQTLKERAKGLSAQKLYKLFLLESPSSKEEQQLYKLFHEDEHIFWTKDPAFEISLEQWKKISERINADLKSFSEGKSNSESLEIGLEEATREKIDYTDFLRRFMVLGEDMQINDDEFDYIYYTYGLSHYGNMPLVEPLEYKNTNKVREFVIAIDTSASCRGELVQNFLRKTCQILRSDNSFFNEVNIHLIQCDSDVRSDVKITSEEDLNDFIENGKLIGFGSTDFRPVFDYVDELIKDKEFENLKGLIYFTDGYGVYPEQMPEYDVAFVFLSEDTKAPAVPSWAIRVVLEEDQIEQFADNDNNSAEDTE